MNCCKENRDRGHTILELPHDWLSGNAGLRGPFCRGPAGLGGGRLGGDSFRAGGFGFCAVGGASGRRASFSGKQPSPSGGCTRGWGTVGNEIVNYRLLFVVL